MNNQNNNKVCDNHDISDVEKECSKDSGYIEYSSFIELEKTLNNLPIDEKEEKLYTMLKDIEYTLCGLDVPLTSEKIYISNGRVNKKRTVEFVQKMMTIIKKYYKKTLLKNCSEELLMFYENYFMMIIYFMEGDAVLEDDRRFDSFISLSNIIPRIYDGASVFETIADEMIESKTVSLSFISYYKKFYESYEKCYSPVIIEAVIKESIKTFIRTYRYPIRARDNSLYEAIRNVFSNTLIELEKMEAIGEEYIEFNENNMYDLTEVWRQIYGD